MATFVYAPPNGPTVEEYQSIRKIGSLMTFCEEHGLDLDDHVAGAKEAVTAGHAKAREMQASLIGKYKETLDAVEFSLIL